MDVARIDERSSTGCWKYEIKLLVLPEAEAPYETTLCVYCEAWRVPRIGTRIQLKVDQKDPHHIAWIKEDTS